MAEVGIRGVRKTYAGGFEAIKGIDCAVGDGEFLVMLGPSGCGKSTLLRMVAGLETISAGEVSIGGRVVNDLEPKDRDIAMVFQNYALYPHMTVYDNMAYGLKIRGMSKSEIEERVHKAADILELRPFLDRRPRQLSGGQRQRVAMGRAIVREPKVFLFDEPLSNLDAKLRTQMRVEINRLQDRLGITSLYVTHDQVEAMTLADRMMVMNGGVAEQIGTPMEVYHRPASTFVAGFIGSPAMNFLPARLTPAGVDLNGGHAVPLSEEMGMAGAAGREVTLGIRPEHLTLESGRGIGDIAVRVELVEALGADTVVHARLTSSGDPLLARLPGSARVATGDTLHFAITPGEVHLFDRQGGRRL
ncbi:sn-glycerol-3-phosphate import ATP-binding protein UgpC [Skermanella mucosa]|uniref:sn-glycerol-3-phosphate import ATP-binding protein UgpC n=1 Tax=Skermanella mucosa TaxID=1789672 RepID=UPI00192B23A7|nr:sn-glycerol-3-phosphate import ATP-binding protein UgpC [Skermanella mucosa]UEM19719.1 sn-glycerol-3-phosphate import ATP-binding protein UgpC [Skermanella mucosa]